ncbi:hypothetical protein SM79_05130 [Klebsiella quasipneumoniae]|nr:hypothetical protein SM79_05130 [Klebsiella quasipneumoniae]
MFKYFILRKQQQLFCYFCGIVLAMVLRKVRISPRCEIIVL